MNTVRMLAIATVVMIAAAGPLLAGSPENGGMIVPNTPEATEVLNKLNQAEYTDHMNAQSYTVDDSEKGQFYYQKLIQIRLAIKRLQSGQSVSRGDIDWALDNSTASTF
ncbi:MAG TPA: hypothetical protein VIX59_05605 [Candidatus Binataceae bacterium]